MKNKWFSSFLILFIVLLFFGLTFPVYANIDPQTIPPDQPNMPTPTPGVQPTNAVNNIDKSMNGVGGACSPGDPGCLGSGSTTTTIVSGTITHINILKYNDNNMANTLVKALLTMSVEGGGGLASFFKGVYSVLFEWGKNDSLSKIREDTWMISASIAALLSGLSLLLIIAVSMTHGSIAIRGFEDARAAMINWFVSVALAGSSLFLLGKLLNLSDAIGAAILASLGSSTAGDIFEPAHFFGRALFAPGATFVIEGGLLFLPIQTLVAILFCALFILFLMVMLFVSVVLATASRTALVFLAIVLAPMILVISSFGPLSWLKSTWIKLITFAFLLGPINALLIGLIMKFQVNAVPFSGGFSLAGFFSFIPNTIMMFAMASILLTINLGVGKLVYGSAIEVGSNVMGSMGGILNGAMAVGGFAGGMAALGGGGTTPDTGGDPTSTPPNTSSPNGISNSSSSNPFSNFGNGGGSGDSGISGGNNHGSELASRLGSIMASSGIPGVSGAGAGLKMASAVNDFNKGGGLSAVGGSKSGSKQTTPSANNSTIAPAAPGGGSSSSAHAPGASSNAPMSLPTGAAGSNSGQGLSDFWSQLPGGRGGVQGALLGNGEQPGSIMSPEQTRKLGKMGIDPASFKQNAEGNLDKVAEVMSSSGYSPAELGRGFGYSFNNDEKLGQYAIGTTTAALTTGTSIGAKPPIFNGEVVSGSSQIRPSASNVGAAIYISAVKSQQFGNNFSSGTVKDLANVLHYGEVKGGQTHQDMYAEISTSPSPTHWMDQKVNELGKDEFFNNQAYGYNGNQVSFDQKYNNANDMWNK